jgi:hypothetical protein
MNKIERAIYDVKLHIEHKQSQFEILKAQLVTLEAVLKTMESIQQDDSIPNETKTIGTMKEQETIEETAEIFYSEQSKAYEDATEPMFDNSRYLVAGFIDGAKWQQEQAKAMEREHRETHKYTEFDLISAFEYGWNQRHFDKTDEDELQQIQKRFIQSINELKQQEQ